MTFASIRQTIRSSLYDPEFYVQLRSHTLAMPLKIYAVLGILALGTGLGVLYARAVPFAFSSLPEQVVALYPNDGLAITLSNGEISINKPQPYYVLNPLTEKMLGTTSPKYLLIFDGNDTLGMDLDQNSTLALIKKTYLIAPDNDGSGNRITTFGKDEGTTTLTKVDVVSFMDSVKPYFAPAVIVGGFILVALGTVAGTFLWILFLCLYCLIPAALVWLFMYVRKTPLMYLESYLTVLYASIPVAIASFVLTILGLPLPALSFTLLVLIIVVVNLTQDAPTRPI